MKEEHNIEIISYKKIWEGIKEYHDNEVEKHNKKKTIMKIKRGVFLKHFKPLLQRIKEETELKMTSVYGMKGINTFTKSN